MKKKLLPANIAAHVAVIALFFMLYLSTSWSVGLLMIPYLLWMGLHVLIIFAKARSFRMGRGHKMTFAELAMRAMVLWVLLLLIEVMSVPDIVPTIRSGMLYLLLSALGLQVFGYVSLWVYYYPEAVRSLFRKHQRHY